jgi:hypothetical protein
MDTHVFEEYADSISRVAVCSMGNRYGCIGKMKEGGPSDLWERIQKWSLFQAHGYHMQEDSLFQRFTMFSVSRGK